MVVVGVQFIRAVTPPSEIPVTLVALTVVEAVAVAVAAAVAAAVVVAVRTRAIEISALKTEANFLLTMMCGWRYFLHF
jgi:hypothetical protein